MANIGDWEQMKLINELTLGKELAKQLQVHLNVPSSSRETREILVRRILNSYEKALSMLSCSTGSSSLSVGDQPHHPAGGAVVVGMSESPPSLGGSPHSEDSDRDTKDQINKHKDPAGSSPTARKCMPRWTQQVRVSPGMGLEGPLDDGFSWRKYGQKDILGAKYPRGYYRCSHRNVQGCLATKQVQRSDEDPTIFEITYRGRHTCTQATSHIPPPSQPQENQEPIIETQQHIHHQSHQENNPAPQPQQQSQEPLFHFGRELKVITEDLEDSDLHDHQQPFPNSFHFINPSTSNSSSDQNGSTMFPPSMLGSSYMGNFSPSFASPSASGVMQQSYGGNQNFQSCDQYELITHHDHHVVSAATSTTNSPTVGFDFPFGNRDQYGPNFTFDDPAGFFS